MAVQTQYELRLDNKCEVINKKETMTLICSNPSCKQPLLIIHHTPTESKRISYNFRVQCPYCPRRSYDFEVTGDLKYVPVDGVLLIDVQEDYENNVVTIQTKKAN